MAGKNKTERGFRIWFDDSGGTARDLSAYLVPGSCQGGGFTFDEVDMSGVSNTVKNVLAGWADAPVTAQFIMDDTATTGSTTVLNGMAGKAGTLTLQWGSDGAAPTTGDPEFEGEFTLLSANITNSGGKFVHNCTFKPSSSVAPAWGTYS